MPEIVPLQGPLGARVEGLDRCRASEPAVATFLNRALAEHLLVVVPGERMAPEETLAFARAFGKPRTQLLRYKHSGGVPDVSIMVSTLMADGTTDKTAIRAEDWHTDDSYFAVPAKATLLHGIEIPSRGGATWFCNMHSVYEALPETLRQRIDGRRAIHGYDTPRARNRPSARTPQEIAETPDVEHPLVRTHPETGRKSLYLNPEPARPHRRARTHRERRAARRAGGRGAQAGAPFRPRLEDGRHRDLGQPRHHAPGDDRLPGGRAARHAARADRGRQAVLVREAARRSSCHTERSEASHG